MSVPVECPKCRHLFYVPDEYVGKKGKCPKCPHIFRAEPEQVETFPSAPPEEDLPTMPIVTSGGKKHSPAPSFANSDSSADIPTFVTLASRCW